MPPVPLLRTRDVGFASQRSTMPFFTTMTTHDTAKENILTQSSPRRKENRYFLFFASWRALRETLLTFLASQLHAFTAEFDAQPTEST